MDIKAKEIRCQSKGHIHKKLLLVVGDDHLSVFCKEHGWLKIELSQGSEPISFKNVRAKISSHGIGTNFDFDPIPVVVMGELKSNRKAHGSPA